MNSNDLPSVCQLLDVRLADDFEACHLTGAKNNCLFEVDFANRLDATAPDPTAVTVIYGANGKSGEAPAALEKLKRLGYSNLHLLEGGLEGATQAGLTTTIGKPLPPSPAMPHGRLAVNAGDSVVQWTGRNLLNKHWGTIGISEGFLDFNEGMLTGGSIRLNLMALQCTDLQGTDLHDVLIAHLHNDDFFDVSNHPIATLEITGSESLPNSAAGAPNLRVNAMLTLRGQTHPIDFDAATGLTPDGHAAAQALFSIDRTRWGVLYGSGQLFHRLAGHLVNDMIDFDVKITTS